MWPVLDDVAEEGRREAGRWEVTRPTTPSSDGTEGPGRVESIAVKKVKKKDSKTHETLLRSLEDAAPLRLLCLHLTHGVIIYVWKVTSFVSQ